VKPDTVIRWHRSAFARYWTWKSHRRTGRPAVAVSIRDLIRRMSQANRLWGAPRIHGELLKLGIEVAVQSNYSCGTCIIPEQASETLPAFNAIARATSRSRLGEQHEVSLPLVRALGMEVHKILVESAPQRTLTEQNEPGKTLFLYRAPNVPRRRSNQESSGEVLVVPLLRPEG